jgi:hypothetical protein
MPVRGHAENSTKAGDAGMTRRLQQQHREHGDRRHALELVDQDRDRNSADCLHRSAAGDDRHCAPPGGQQGGAKIDHG